MESIGGLKRTLAGKTIYQFNPTLFLLDSTFNGANGLCTGQVMFKASGIGRLSSLCRLQLVEHWLFLIYEFAPAHSIDYHFFFNSVTLHACQTHLPTGSALHNTYPIAHTMQ
jgi:hypothetical protein